MELEKFYYDNKTVKWFAYAVLLWAIVGMLAGLWDSIALFYPGINLGLPATTFGRMRPVHTNAVIFAFVGNGIFMGIYYSLQRLCKDQDVQRQTEQDSFLGMAIDYCCGCNLAIGQVIQPVKNMPNLEWPIDIAIAIVWISFRHKYVWHHSQTTRKPYLCCHLVLHRHMGNRCDAAHCQFN